MSRTHVWPGVATGIVLATAMSVLLSGSVSAQTGTITTVAGGGPASGPADQASLRGNVKAVSDAAGNLYVSDGFAHRVYRRDAASGTLSVVAGDGFAGYSGDGGPAVQARLSNPYGLALDETLNRLYVADIDHSVIRAIDLASGLISTFAGTGTCGDSGDNGPANAALLCNLLSDLALDSNGVLYFANDFGGWRIRAVENGTIRTIAGNGVMRGALDGPDGDPADDYLDGVPATTASLGAVTALAADPIDGSLHFYEQAALATGGARFRRVAPGTGTLTTYAGNGVQYGQIDGPGGDPADDIVEGAAALQSALAYTTSMAVAGGELYAAVYTVGLIRRVSSNGNGTAGIIETIVGGGTSQPLNVPPLDAYLVSPTGVSLDANGVLYIADASHFGDGGREVYAASPLVINPVVGNGWGYYCGDGGPATAACSREPRSARMDPGGNLIIVDEGNLKIRSVSPAGNISTLIPSLFSDLTIDIWPLAPGQFLYADTGGHTIYRADPPYSSFFTFAGTGSATGSIDGPGGDPADDLNDGELAWVASLSSPASLVRDAQGHTFIADLGNHRVRRVDAVNEVISTVAGTGTEGFNGDGLPGTATDLHVPYGLAFDTNGDLLVSERGGHRVRRISAGADGLVTGAPDETVSTVAGTGVLGFSGDGGDATQALLGSPAGLAVDVLGNIYIADGGNHAIRRIDPQTALIETIAGRGTGGDGPAVDAELVLPLGLSTAVLSGTRYLFVADSGGHRVRRIDLGPAQPPANHPPVVDPLGLDGFSVTATSPAGARIGLYANATDPDGDLLTYTWTGPFGTVTGLGVSALLPIGVSTVTVDVDDGHGHVVSRSATVTVLGENTFTGNGEVVTPPDDHERRLSGETQGRITVTFLGPVTAPGLTWFRTRTDQVPPPPLGKQLGSAPLYYDIATTAVADGDVRICLDLTGMSFAYPAQVELHRLSGAWNGLGVSPDPATHIVCAQAPFGQVFGAYASFTPEDPAALVATVAGNGQAGYTGDGGPAVQARLEQPGGLAFDAARSFLYIGDDSYRVRRVNLTTGVIETIAGTGTIEAPTDGVDARLSSLGSMRGLALDADGNLFIGDVSHCLVRRVDVNTNVITTVGGQWRGPGLTCGHAGDGGPATAARLGLTHRLAFDAQGNLLVAEQPFLAGSDGGYIRLIAKGPDGRITGLDPAETIVTVAGNGTQDIFVNDGLHPLAAGVFPYDVAAGPGGGIYIGDGNGVLLVTPGADGVLDGSADESITRVFGSPVGYTVPFQGDGGRAKDAWSDAGAVAMLPSGDLLVTSTMVRRMRRISGGSDGIVNGGADETIVTVAGFSDDSEPPAFNGDGHALATRFAWPVEIVPAGPSTFFVADLAFDRVRRVGPATGGTPAADLFLTASAAPDPVAAGGSLTYTTTVTNSGPDAAHAVRLSMPVPATQEFVGSSPAGVCTGPAAGTAGNIVCNLGDLPAAESTSVTLETRPTAAGPLSSTLTVSANETDPNATNNSVAVSLTVRLDPVVLLVEENILVTDAPTLTASLMLNVSETILVTDTPTPTPSVLLNVVEDVTVADTPVLTPSLMLAIAEAIVVSDAPALLIDPAPTVTIDQAPGQADPTTTAPIAFAVTFSEPVTGFDDGDVSLAGSTVGGTLSASVAGSGADYTVSVSGMSGTGKVVAAIPAGAATDSAGNPNAASTSVDNTVLFETIVATTTTTLTSSRNPSLTTAPPVFTAAVGSASGTPPTGQVEFFRNGSAMGRSPLFERGGARVAVIGGTTLDVAGSPHTITARYLGDATHQPSDSAPLQQAVLPGTYFAEAVPGPAGPLVPVALNDAGQIAGYLGDAISAGAAVYDPVQGFRMLDGTSSFSHAADMNAAGVIVGRRGPDAVTTTGFVDRRGVLQSISSTRSAAGINGRDQIAVNLEDGTAAVHQAGTTTVLDLFEAHAINDAGVVVGAVGGADGQPDAVVFEGGALANLGRFGQAFASATRVNNAGTVLVRAGDLFGPELPLLYRGSLATGLGTGRPWDVNDADVAVVGADEARVHLGAASFTLDIGLVTGMAINNRGEIVGSVSGQLKRWTPVPTSALVVNPVTAMEDDEVTLTATLTSQGAPVPGQPIVFTLNGSFAGSATTGPDGVATFTDVFFGLAIGVHPQGVRASFAGSPTLGDSAATASLTVQAIDPADLAVFVSTQGAVVVGSNLTINVTPSNLGPSSASIMRVNVTLPAGLQYISDNAQGACSFGSGLGTCDFENVGAGTSRAFAIVVRPTTLQPLTASFVVSGLRFDPNLANNSASLTVDAPPTVTINQAPSQLDPTNVSPIQFAVVFSEPVTGFAGNDVSFAGSTVGGTLTATVTGSGASYTVSVAGMSGVGLVSVSIPAGAATDSGGNPSRASTSTDRTVLYGVSTAYGIVFPSNGGWALFTVVNSGGQITGFLSYSRAAFSYNAARITSFVISGQTATIEGFSSNGRLFVAKLYDGGTSLPDRFHLWVEGVERTPPSGALSGGNLVMQPWSPDTRLKGWVDLHTHPMSHLAFGGKLFHGAPAVGSLLPAVQMPSDPVCRFDVRATSIAEALSQDGPTRGDFIQSKCGNLGRSLIIQAVEVANGAVTAPVGADGYPAFTHWPQWRDITHQKMWVDWIRRAHRYGQRVLVALSHNNRTLGQLVTAGGAGPVSGVTNDKASSELQIDEIKKLIADHSDFMGLATTPAELESIVAGGRLAIVLGVELDKIGDFGPGVSQQTVDAEIAALHQQGVRYVLPIHLVDNAFGDSAIYDDIYNILNFRENGSFWAVGCAPVSDEVAFRAQAFTTILNAFLVPALPPLPTYPTCQATLPGGAQLFTGHVNGRTANGLTSLGEFAVQAMMKRGMIVDIDHMSDRAANRTLALATAVPGGGYPVTSGHSAVRSRTSEHHKESARTTTQLARIACLGGMFGLGTGEKNGTRAIDWAAHYARGYEVMRRAFAPNGLCPQATPLGVGFVALGTDTNSLVKTPRAPWYDPVQQRSTPIYDEGHPANSGVTALTMSSTGTKTWNYNFDGVAHYGMFADFLRDVRTLPANATMTGKQIVDDQMTYGADYFYRMWLKADTQKVRVP